jgi:hypothetical protein
MSNKRKITAKDIVADVRAGLTNAQLMEKYQLSPVALNGIFEKLVNAQILLELELSGREWGTSEPSEGLTATTEAARSYVMFQLPIYDLDDMTVEGHVLDISERELMAEGIAAQVGDVKRLLIQADEFADVYPFSFDAVCRSLENEGGPEELTATFEIASISEVGCGELRKLCRFLGLK